MKFRVKAIRAAIAATTALAAASPHAAIINLIDLGGVTGSPAEVGFKTAANYWAHILTNNATINLGVRFAPLPPNVIGSTGSTKIDLAVATWENRVNATKSNSTIDQNIVLPGLNTGGVSGLTAGVNGSGNNDNNVTAVLNGTQTSSRVLYENTAVVRALGLAAPNVRDGNVTFSSTFAFDFDPQNGITPGTFDFLGVAIHEIGHALGFVSGVDYFDYYGFPNGPGRGALGYDLNDTSIFSALDMFRYSAPGTLDFRTGGTRYFSIDGGNTALLGNLFSTGTYNGDGRQASHWKDTPACLVGNGIMDPTFCFGQMGVVTGLDLAAYDATGWNLSVDALNYANHSSAQIYQAFVVPEPSTWTLVIGSLALLAAARRPRRKPDLPACA